MKQQNGQTQLSLIAFLIVFGLQCSVLDPNITLTLSGYVLDKNTNLPLQGLAVKRFKEIRSGNLFGGSTYDSIEEVKTDSIGYFAFKFIIGKNEYYKICAFKPNEKWTILYCSSANCPCFELSYDLAETNPNRTATFYVENN